MIFDFLNKLISVHYKLWSSLITMDMNFENNYRVYFMIVFLLSTFMFTHLLFFKMEYICVLEGIIIIQY